MLKLSPHQKKKKAKTKTKAKNKKNKQSEIVTICKYMYMLSAITFWALGKANYFASSQKIKHEKIKNWKKLSTFEF